MDPYKALLETRRANLVKLMRLVGVSAAAKLYGCSTSYISQLLSGTRKINERTARQLEVKCGVSVKYLDRAVR